MAKFWVKTTVEYEFEVEADSEAEAEKLGWGYEDYSMNASVYSIEVDEIEDDEEDE